MAVQRMSARIRGTVYRAIIGLLPITGIACGGVTDEGRLPPDVQDPERLKTPSGAVSRYKGALVLLPEAFDRFMTETGILTDELNNIPTPLGVAGLYDGVDARYDLRVFATSYSQLHRVRGEAREARGFLQAYAIDSSPALAGHMYAVEAYADVLLADLFCSGIPLSTVDFDGDYTLAAGSSTDEVYTRALGLFDSALAVTEDSVRLQQFAAVGKGRALLALGRYAEAAAAVAAVSDAYTYQVVFTPGQPAQSMRLLIDFVSGPTNGYKTRAGAPRMGNNEGMTGLDYHTSNDPRVPVDSAGGRDVLAKDTLFFPIKYPKSGAVTLTLASGIEARLIEAEAAVRANAADGQWLTILNHLRQTAITPALPDLVDPGQDGSGTDAPRVDLLFRERAFWLYLTGHRQGDLRRLIRHYLRFPDAVYPTGLYTGGSGAYGTQIVAPVPDTERTNNPNYAGCVHFDA